MPYLIYMKKTGTGEHKTVYFNDTTSTSGWTTNGTGTFGVVNINGRSYLQASTNSLTWTSGFESGIFPILNLANDYKMSFYYYEPTYSSNDGTTIRIGPFVIHQWTKSGYVSENTVGMYSGSPTLTADRYKRNTFPRSFAENTEYFIEMDFKADGQILEVFVDGSSLGTKSVVHAANASQISHSVNNSRSAISTLTLKEKVNT